MTKLNSAQRSLLCKQLIQQVANIERDKQQPTTYTKHSPKLLTLQFLNNQKQ